MKKHLLFKINYITVFLCFGSYSWLREQNCNGFLVQSNHITIPIVTEMKSQLWYCHKNSWTNKIFRWGMPFTVIWWSKPVQKGQVIFFYSFLIPFSIFMFKGSLSKWFILWFQSFLLGFLASFHRVDSSIRINLNSTNLLEFDKQIYQRCIINACCNGNFLW